MVMPRKSPKPKPRPKIEYPPVPTKKWIPPDKRPKKPRPPGYQKPPGVTQKLDISSLHKIWHSFRLYGTTYVLPGTFSQTHKRFPICSNGLQGPLNCMVAIAFSKIFEMPRWSTHFIDSALHMGNELYHITRDKSKSKCFKEVVIPEMQNYFYINGTKVQMEIGNKVVGNLHRTINRTPVDLKTFLQGNLRKQSGILCLQKKYFGLWYHDNAYFMFDPAERSENGKKWTGIAGTGFAVVIRVTSLDKLIDCILEGLNRKDQFHFVFYPCAVLSMVKLNLVPPNSLAEVQTQPTEPPEKVVRKKKPPEPPQAEEEPPPDEEPPEPGVFQESMEEKAEEISAEVQDPGTESKRPSWMQEVPLQRKEVSQEKIPIEKVKAESVTYFRELIPKTMGILRGTFHQNEHKFGKSAGQQSVSQAIMAIAMLRVHKAKTWIQRTVDEVLKNGAQLHGEVSKGLGDGQIVKLKHVPDKIKIDDREFSPDITEYAVLGKLLSPVGEVLDLLPALQDFFRDCDTCIICGPLLLAVWCENQLYYMFDPNERDKNGFVIPKKKLIAPKNAVIEQGTACVTWFTNLKDLVDVYMNNVDRARRRDEFWLSKVLMNDFIKVPDPWHSFQGIAKGKWILRGTFNQNDTRFSRESRNTQCTANATMALAYSTLKPESQWTSDTVDEVLMSGDRLYNSCVAYLKECNKFLDKMLMVDEIQRKFDLENKEVQLDIQDCLVNGIISAKEDMGIPSLKQGFEEFFKENETGVVTSRSISVAVWRKGDVYFYYDSHSRDEYGVINAFGTACCLRILNIDDLAKSVEANFGPSSQDYYNISKVGVTVWEMSEDGIVKIDLNSFVEISPIKAILRSTLHERVPLFPIEHRGKQTIPMCLIALGMMGVFPPLHWSVDLMDEVVRMGETLYVMCMVDIVKKNIEDSPEGEEGEGADDFKITTDNVHTSFHVGLNKVDVTFNESITGNFEENFKEALQNHFTELLETPKDKEEFTHKPLLLESDLQTVLIVKDSEAFYLFDPRPRNEQGELFGKDEWSAKILPPEPEPEEEEEEGELEEEKEFDEERPQSKMEVGGGDAEPGEEEGEEGEGETEEEREARLREEEEEAERIRLEREARIEERNERIKFWDKEAENLGFACVLRFTNMDGLVEHILENTPPNARETMEFTLKSIDFTTEPDTKQVFDAEMQERNDPYAGDWYEFKEIDHGFWSLRGTMDQANELFPVYNRDKQTIPNCYSAIAYAVLYNLTKFKSKTVDDILKYGDRLLTFTKKICYNEAKTKGLGIPVDELKQLIFYADYSLDNMCRKFCIAEHRCTVDLVQDFIVGDLNASDDMEEIYSIKRALEEFFTNYKYGLLSAKGLYVAIWRGQAMYYMFDSHARGPNGVKIPTGVACITRYMSLDTLIDIFKQNLPIKEGLNTFQIHKVAILECECERERQPDLEEKPPEPKTTGYITVSPGKKVLSGSISQNDRQFDKPKGVLSAPVAVVALTFTLVHQCTTWTKPIVDEILVNGNELYDKSVESMGYAYNPWTQQLTLELVKNDYKVGKLKANCELRKTDQRGIIDIKDSPILNLRQGIEHFFEENTHGVLQTEFLTVGLWEEDGEIIYMFDPNPRGKTGLPAREGAACVVTFVNAKMASDHIISLLPADKYMEGEFVITPVEIVVGDKRTKRKVPVKKKPEVPPPLPECSKAVADAEKRRLRKMDEEKRKRKEAKRIALIGRNQFDDISATEGIVRGLRSQAHPRYGEERNKQDLTNCIVCCIMHKLLPVNDWSCKIVDLILNLGHQLYIDSYITYKPIGGELRVSQVLRELYVKNRKIRIMLYNSKIREPFLHSNVVLALTNILQQENGFLLTAQRKWISVMFKEGLYYFFDPRDYDHEGKKTEVGKGSALVHRFQSIDAMTTAILYHMIDDPSDSIGKFKVLFIRIGTE